MASYGNVENSTKETLEVRQAKIEAVNAYKETLEDEERLDHEERLEDSIGNMMDNLSIYSVFGDELDGINGALVEAGVYVAPKYSYEHGFDDIQEVADLKDKAQRLVNRTRGSNVAGVADAIQAVVDKTAPNLVAELVHLSLDSESQTL